MTKAKTRAAKRGVIVTTAHRGVFFGYTDANENDQTVVLDRARMCIYWSSDLRGFLGLASHGPNGNCKITRPVTSLELRYITSVVEMTPEAIAAWEAVK